MISPHFHGRTDLGFLIPTEIVLVAASPIPPILSNTYAGVQNVDPAVRDAAPRHGHDRLRRCCGRSNCPNSLPLIFSGVRSATLQVIATATIAAYLPLGGLGRFIYDGLRQQDFPQMVGGGVLVAVLAVVIDLVLALVQRLVVSRGCLRPVLEEAADGGSARPTPSAPASNADDAARCDPGRGAS